MVIALGPGSPKTRYVTQSADLQFQTLYLKLPMSIKNKSSKHFKSRKKHIHIIKTIVCSQKPPITLQRTPQKHQTDLTLVMVLQVSD